MRHLFLALAALCIARGDVAVPLSHLTDDTEMLQQAIMAPASQMEREVIDTSFLFSMEEAKKITDGLTNIKDWYKIWTVMRGAYKYGNDHATAPNAMTASPAKVSEWAEAHGGLQPIDTGDSALVLFWAEPSKDRKFAALTARGTVNKADAIADLVDMTTSFSGLFGSRMRSEADKNYVLQALKGVQRNIIVEGAPVSVKERILALKAAGVPTIATGHSLGGGIALNLAKYWGLPAMCFSAPGAFPGELHHNGNAIQEHNVLEGSKVIYCSPDVIPFTVAHSGEAMCDVCQNKFEDNKPSKENLLSTSVIRGLGKIMSHASKFGATKSIRGHITGAEEPGTLGYAFLKVTKGGGFELNGVSYDRDAGSFATPHPKRRLQRGRNMAVNLTEHQGMDGGLLMIEPWPCMHVEDQFKPVDDREFFKTQVDRPILKRSKWAALKWMLGVGDGDDEMLERKVNS